MTQESILGASKVVAFAPVTDAARARAFYEGVLGLRLVEDQKPFAMVFDANGTTLRVTPVGEFKPQPFTVLGWEVESIETTVERLTAAGVVFMRIPGMNDADPLGIWTAPGGARIAWFKDPDGNVLSVGCTQSAAADLAWVAAEVMVGCGRDGGWGWRSRGGPPFCDETAEGRDVYGNGPGLISIESFDRRVAGAKAQALFCDICGTTEVVPCYKASTKSLSE